MMNKQAAAATLLVALVATATAVITTQAVTMPDDVVTAMSSSGGHGGRRHRGPTWRDHDDGGSSSSNRSPLSGLTECVTVCGTGVTGCMLDCYKPGVGFDPVGLPICLLKCTNDAMVCGSGCATNLI